MASNNKKIAPNFKIFIRLEIEKFMFRLWIFAASTENILDFFLVKYCWIMLSLSGVFAFDFIEDVSKACGFMHRQT